MPLLILHPVLLFLLALQLLSLPFAAALNTNAQLLSWNATGCESGVGQPLVFRSLADSGVCNNITHYVDDGEGDPVSLQIYCRAHSVQLLWFDGTYGCGGRAPIINHTWDAGTSPTACQSVYGSFSIKVMCGLNGAARAEISAAGMMIVAALAVVATWSSL